MDSIRVSEAPDSSSILDEATKLLIRPILVLLGSGVFLYWACISEQRAVKREKEKLTPRVPQRVPQNNFGVHENEIC